MDFAARLRRKGREKETRAHVELAARPGSSLTPDVEDGDGHDYGHADRYGRYVPDP